MDLESFDRTPSNATLIQRASRVNRMRRQIGELETLRESVASDEPDVLVVLGSPGAGKTRLFLNPIRDFLGIDRVPQSQLLQVQAGTAVPIASWPTSAEATLADGTTPTLATIVASNRAVRLPRTPAERIPPYRPIQQRLRLAGIDLPEPLAGEKQPNTVAGLAFRQGSRSFSQLVSRPADPVYDVAIALAPFCEPQPDTLLIRLERLHLLREGMLRLVDGILTALKFALILFLAAFARGPNVRSIVLVLVATSRHYGHRSEPDDHALPAHRRISVIGGESVLSC
jgi:hypothetical protein